METVKATAESVAAKVTATVQGKKAIHFGSGNIGRGFVAEFLHKSGYEVIFVDVIDDLINKIKSTSSYEVTEIGTDSTQTFTITNYRALHSIKENDKVVEEIASGDIVTCAVGPTILNRIAPTIAKGIDARTLDYPLAVIACENAIGATDTLMGYVKKDLKTPEGEWSNRFRSANSAIDRIVPGQDANAGLNVKIEKFYEWCVEKPPFDGTKNGHPKIHGVHFVDDLTPYIERKLFTVNTSHATAAYYGHYRGKHIIHEAMADPDIKDKVRNTLKETAHLIVTKHGISVEDQNEYVETIIKRISNPHLQDVTERVGRAPLRKLSRKERFIGPAAELAQRGDSVDYLLGGIEMAFRFTDVKEDEESVKLKQLLQDLSAEEVTSQITGLEKSDKLYERVVEVVKKVQNK